MKLRYGTLIAGACMLGFAASAVSDPEPDWVSQDPVASPEWCDLYSTNSPSVKSGDVIGVFAPDGAGSHILVGKHNTILEGKYGFIHAYGDDATTPEKDGAISGEALTFKAWRPIDAKEYDVSPLDGSDPVYQSGVRVSEDIEIEAVQETMNKATVFKWK